MIVEDEDITNKKRDGLICVNNNKGYYILTYTYVTEFVTCKISRFLFDFFKSLISNFFELDIFIVNQCTCRFYYNCVVGQILMLSLCLVIT